MNQSVLRIVRLSFTKENVESFIEIFNESHSKIEAFDGCQSVQLRRDFHHPNVYYTVSQWVSQEALDKYRDSKLFQTTWARTKVLFNDKPQAFSLISDFK